MDILPGTIRISAKTLKPCQKTRNSWIQCSRQFPELMQVVNLFTAQGKRKDLVDSKNPRFLKGQLSPEGREQGARIPILPTGEKLEKAFSLFSPHLKIHDQDSHDHWDVIYQNKGGTWSYVYTMEKRKAHRAGKYRKVDEFHRCYPRLLKAISSALKNHPDSTTLALYTMLKTCMRIGNETYFRAHGHKGLSTLMKKDISIKGSVATFRYIGKDGVPISISKEFPSSYITALRNLIRKKTGKEFVFCKNNHPLHEQDFKEAFRRFTGREFYPHIIRSHYATFRVKQFLSKRKKVTKESVQSLYLSLAHELQHKKFNKNTRQWQEHYAVTVRSYVQPELVQRVEQLLR